MKIYKKISTLAMMLALAASSLTSCYDDSELRESIAGLESRIQQLEKDMAANVSALQSMISVGSIASWSYNAETGRGTITLLDGQKIEINQSISGYSIITVEKGEDGMYYWAICKDGANLPLTVDNKRVPVSVTPALKISQENEWMISVDGGKTWVRTGISYFTGESSEDDGTSDGPVNEAVLFEKVEVDGDVLVLTLVGGEEVRVAVVGEAVFRAVSDTLWFSRALMEKSVMVEMSHVKAYTITEKPEGWKARIEDDSYLFVTAPEDLKESPVQGTVKVLAVFDNGAVPEIMCVEVIYEPYLTLARANGVVSVKMAEHTAEDFTGYVLVGWKSSKYSPDSAAEWLNGNAASIVPYQGSATYELTDLIEDYSITEEYVVFAAPYLPAAQVAQGNMRYEESDLVSIQTVAVSEGWTISDIRFDYAELHAVMDVSEYFGGFFAAERWDAQAREDMIELLSQGNGEVCTSVMYDGPVNGFPYGNIEGRLVPATEYVVWYVPVAANGVYVAEDFVEHRFTTPDVTYDAALAAPSCEIKDVASSGFTAVVTPAASCYRTYAAIVKSAAIAELATDDDIASYIVKVGSFTEGSTVNTVSASSFSPEDEVCLLAVSFTEEGGYGAIVNEKVALRQLVFTEDLGVSVTGYECDEAGTVTMSLEFKGSPETITYVAASYTYFSEEQIQKFLALGQMPDAVSTKISKLDGKLVFEGLMSGVEYKLYALVADAEGNNSFLYTYTFTPVISIEYILSTDPGYEYGMPQITGTLTTSFSGKTYRMTVNMPQECRRYWLFCGDAEYLPGDVYAKSDKMVNMELELSGETMHTESVSLTYDNIAVYTRIYMVWQDIDGRYHAIYEFNPNK